MAEVAATTGARVLVIAIAGENGKVIKDLTEAAECCGLIPKVIPSLRELLTGHAQSRASVIPASPTCSDAGR